MSGATVQPAEIAPTKVADQLRALGVQPGAILLVHTSYRAVGPVSGGPLGLIEALHAALGRDGTLVIPSWTGDDDEPFDPAAIRARLAPFGIEPGEVVDRYGAEGTGPSIYFDDPEGNQVELKGPATTPANRAG